jgi:hypothetical protein
LDAFLNGEIRNRCLFIHHENWNCPPEHPNLIDSPQLIGVYGVTIYKGLDVFLWEAKRQGICEQCSLLILRRTGNIEQLDCSYRYPLRGVELHQRSGGFTRQEMEEYHTRMKWILLPYSKDMYKVSMSGIFMDAIRLRIPIIALNIPIVSYYNSKGEIGIVADTMEELVERVAKEIVAPDTDGTRQRAYNGYCDNLKRLQELSWNESLKTIREEIGYE